MREASLMFKTDVGGRRNEGEKPSVFSHFNSHLLGSIYTLRFAQSAWTVHTDCV